MTPVFAIVGHPNKGKSSIVATLAHNDSIRIEPTSGTTRSSQRYSVTIDDREVYALIDTPGFQRPRQVLYWLKQHCPDAASRRQWLQSFIDAHANNGKFDDEIELLRPILEGACIIYVVDGSKPYQADYEAEMEILQWSGEPRMALINPVDGLACVPQWQQALGQFFSLVQVFNPMLADIAQQMQLLESFALLKTDWKESLSRARGILDRQLQYRRRRSSEMLVAFIEDALCHRCRKNLAADTNRSETVRILKDRYADALRSKERQNRVQIEQLYQHRRLQSDPAILALESSDLMDRQSWSIWGLERKKVAALAAGSGALAGAVIDAGVGGSSLMLGALSGAAIGGVATWFWGKELARVRIHGYFSLARQYVEVGPVRNPVFAWALFGRAVLHLHAIRQRSHARRDKLALDTDTASALDRFDSKEKAIISRWLLAGSAGKMQRRREEITALIQERV